MIFFGVCCLWYKHQSKKIVAKAIADDISCADYSFYVSGFPSTGVKESDLKSFFTQYG